MPGFNCVVFRRETTHLNDLIDKSEALVPCVYPGLSPAHSPYFRWSFPSGAKVHYRHLQREHDYQTFDGWEINLLIFDELTHFTRKQYLALCARVRTSKPGLPTRIRATTNPGGEGHEWVFERWGPWLDPEFEGIGLAPRLDSTGKALPPAKPGEVLWVVTRKDGVEEYHRNQVPGSLSRTFIPARLADNPYIGSSYELTLNQLDAVRRDQLRDGDWLVKPAAGKYFKREWIKFVDHAPEGVRWIRNWDLAATEKTSEKDDPDYTAGVLMGLWDGHVVIGHAQRRQSSPGDVAKFINATAEMDGVNIAVGIPQDPGQAGKSQVAQYIEYLDRFMVVAETETGDKVQRFGPFSTQAEHGKVIIVRGPWNNEFISELEAFPTKGVHDDYVDATSGGYRRLKSGLISDGSTIHIPSRRR